MAVGLALGAQPKLDRQPSLFAYAMLTMRDVFPSPRAKGNKKAQSPHTHVTPSNGRLCLQETAFNS
jgi:hypothetical protein